MWIVRLLGKVAWRYVCIVAVGMGFVFLFRAWDGLADSCILEMVFFGWRRGGEGRGGL